MAGIAGFKTRVPHILPAPQDQKAEVAKHISANSFKVLPSRWVVERTCAWLVNHRRLRIDYEPDPVVTAGWYGPQTPGFSYTASPPKPLWADFRDSFLDPIVLSGGLSAQQRRRSSLHPLCREVSEASRTPVSQHWHIPVQGSYACSRGIRSLLGNETQITWE